MTEGRDKDSAGAISKDRFDIRPYRPGDEEKITEMFNEVFSQQRQLDHWYWKYRDNPLGSHYISLAVADDCTIGSHYGGYPVVFYCKTSDSGSPREFLTLHLGDKMTRKRFRGVGFGRNSLLVRTFLHFKNTFARGMPFGYGFGTHHSLRIGLLFLKYADIEPVSYRTLSLATLDRPWVAGLRNILTRRRARKVSEVDGDWTDFFYRAAPSYRYLLKRDEPYLRWRYLKRPDREYLLFEVKKRGCLAGWSVFYRKGEKIIWGDALFLPGDIGNVQALLLSLKSHPSMSGATSIECWFPPRPTWWDLILKQLGFITVPEPSNLHFTGPVFEDHSAADLLRKYFYYTIGDSDLF